MNSITKKAHRQVHADHYGIRHLFKQLLNYLSRHSNTLDSLDLLAHFGTRMDRHTSLTSAASCSSIAIASQKRFDKC